MTRVLSTISDIEINDEVEGRENESILASSELVLMLAGDHGQSYGQPVILRMSEEEICIK